jgi:hypothetical protein
MLLNTQQLAVKLAKPLSKFSLSCADVGIEKSDKSTIEYRVKIFFIFLGLNCERIIFLSSEATVMLPGNFFF